MKLRELKFGGKEQIKEEAAILKSEKAESYGRTDKNHMMIWPG